MRLSSFYVTLGLALLAFSAPLDDNDNTQVGSIQSLHARSGKGNTGGKGGKATSTPVAAGGHHTTTTTTSAHSSTSTSTGLHGIGTATHTTPSVPSSSASTCPLLSTSKKSSKGSKLGKRAPVKHPLGKSDVTLFHGTDKKDDANSLKSQIKLSVIKSGDLHDTEVEGVDGGFYLTDSLLGAAQFGCRNTPLTDSEKKAGVKLQESVFVLEFKWAGADLEVKDYQPGPDFQKFLDYDKQSHSDAALDKIMTDNDMITGPMNAPGADFGLAPDFWQYVVIKQQAIDTGKLTYVTTHEVICSAVPPAKQLTAEYWSNSQKSSLNFPQTLKDVTTKDSTCVGKFDWEAAMAEDM